MRHGVGPTETETLHIGVGLVQATGVLPTPSGPTGDAGRVVIRLDSNAPRVAEFDISTGNPIMVLSRDAYRTPVGPGLLASSGTFGGGFFAPLATVIVKDNGEDDIRIGELLRDGGCPGRPDDYPGSSGKTGKKGGIVAGGGYSKDDQIKDVKATVDFLNRLWQWYKVYVTFTLNGDVVAKDIDVTGALSTKYEESNGVPHVSTSIVRAAAQKALDKKKKEENKDAAVPMAWNDLDNIRLERIDPKSPDAPKEGGEGKSDEDKKKDKQAADAAASGPGSVTASAPEDPEKQKGAKVPVRLCGKDHPDYDKGRDNPGDKWRK